MTLFFPIFMGMFAKQLLIGIIIGIITFFYWKKAKGKGHDNLAFYAKYWFLPAYMTPQKFTPDSYIRSYIG